MNLLQLAALSWLVWAGYWILARGFVKTTKSTEGAALGMLHVVPLAVGIYLIFHGSASGVFKWPLYVSPLPRLLYRAADWEVEAEPVEAR